MSDLLVFAFIPPPPFYFFFKLRIFVGESEFEEKLKFAAAKKLRPQIE